MGSTLSRTRIRGRRTAPVELAVAFALGGSLFAIALPAFFREMRSSRFVEPLDGLQRIGRAAVAYGQTHSVAEGFPPTAAMTPPSPPRGHCEADPPEAWDAPTWRALTFMPVPSGVPHCFAFAFESTLAPAVSVFRAHAHGDLDGDGIASTFEVTGQYVEGDPRGPVVTPGMFIDSEVE